MPRVRGRAAFFSLATSAEKSYTKRESGELLVQLTGLARRSLRPHVRLLCFYFTPGVSKGEPGCFYLGANVLRQTRVIVVG